MKLTLQIEIGNDAMQTYRDIRNALDYVRKTMANKSGGHRIAVNNTNKPWQGEGASILDMNGNKVGFWEIEQ